MPVYDALLLVSFGGPERPEDVMPFLDNVARGKNVPPERLQEVAAHYALFDGLSPINAQVRALLAALVDELGAHGPRLPVYWGNRHWHPLLTEALEQMADDGVQRALAFVTSAFGSYPGCRAYLEDIQRARQQVGKKAPLVDKIRLYYNHPGFIAALAERTLEGIEQVAPQRRPAAHLVFTAHSLPLAMAARAPYEAQLREACSLVVEQLLQHQAATAGRAVRNAESTDADLRLPWTLAYQSRSGPPSQPWLEPDVRQHARELAAGGQVRDVVVVPIGFVCEHMEVAYDLDVELRQLCEQLGLNLVRAGVVGCHRRFVQMIRELIQERISDEPVRLAWGGLGPAPDVCAPDCCLPG